MYPDDQTPPTNRNSLKPPPDPFVLEGEDDDKGASLGQKLLRNRALLVSVAVSLVLLLVLAVVLLLLVLGSSGKSDNDAPAHTNRNEQSGNSSFSCNAKLRGYQNQDLGLRFCYPEAWGEVSVTDAKIDPSDNGTRVRLNFASKPQIHIGLVSDNWSTQVNRDVSCIQQAAQKLPDTSSFSVNWDTDGQGGAIASGIRGLELSSGEYLIQERVDNVLTNGVCFEGYKQFDGAVYKIAEATFFVPFIGRITTPQAHINDPTVLVPANDRFDFVTFVKTIQKF